MKVLFSIEYRTQWGEELVLVAGAKKYPMTWNAGGLWTVEADCTAAQLRDYSYEVHRAGIVIRQEWSHHSCSVKSGAKVIDSWIDAPQDANPFVRKHSAEKFDKKGFRGAGTAIPVFSLRSEDDFGVGEFLDLKKMVDWAAATGQSIIQLLPINDTTMTHTWEDSYPYNANSTFALHPQFLNLAAAGVKMTAALKKKQAALNALDKVDYEAVNSEKTKLMKKLFASSGAEVLASAEYQEFVKSNKDWLVPYAVFCALRDENGTPDFSKWGEYAKYTKKKADEYYKAHAAEVDFHCYIQYHLDKQLKEVCEYAHAKGVFFKGDLPIGISRTSVDAWCFPKLFNMNSQAGAPPDAFSEDGQNWGFPTYNWEEMAKDDYAWWKARLAKMAEYFDAFRIDHILGFFRIWEIPVPEKSGLMGHFSPAMPYAADEITSKGLPLDGLFIEDPRRAGFYHPLIGARKGAQYQQLNEWQRWSFNDLYDDFFYRRHNDFWRDQAMRKLPALLGSTGMLACGEDLGMIPACVPAVMDSQKILSLEIQRMPKDPSQTFAHPAQYPYFCVCTTSTHDMPPVRGWWETEDKQLIQRFYNEELGRGGEAPYFCEPDICRQIMAQHLYSPAMLVILPLQDWLAMDGSIRLEDAQAEQINIPAIPRHYWRYRMHLTLEQLCEATEFNALVSGMIRDCGR
ncbi:MAG: 4-alpha-glucanotransferase [Bacteroidales bacterium]|nr:4-alpha-glucanotransferase [Bacteroidales bacterium]